jgi:hypothetical protein
VFSAITVTSLLVAPCATLAAQGSPRSALRGRLTADSGRTIVADAEVVVPEASRTTHSDSAGRFFLGALSRGTYTVRIRHPAWQPVQGRVTITDVDTVEMNVAMVPLGVALPEVEIRGRAIPPGLRDFERRRATTAGKFLTAEEIRGSGAQSLTSLVLGRIGGFEVVPLAQGGHAIATRRTGVSLSSRMVGNTCFAQVWLDGQLIFSTKAGVAGTPPRLEDFDLDKISGIEFYKSSSVPPELNGPGGECGTVAIWMAVPRPRKP